jgi:beta-N-acetylhexosaminidase
VIAGVLLLAPACRANEHGTIAGPSASVSTARCSLAQVVAGWRLRRLAWQTVVVPVQETNVAAVAAQVAAGAGGVILFGSAAPANLGSALRQLTARALGGIRPFVMADEEGGFVQRMANLVGSMPTARTMGATMTPLQIQHLAHDVATRMAAAAVTMNLAPVLDLDGGSGPNSTDAIGTRSFSTSAAIATADGLAFARGMRNAGVVPVVKHFPGLGGATANTDIRAAWTRPWNVLKANDLKPFQAAVETRMPAEMTSNARVPGLTSMPASLSFAANRVLRRRLGFDRLVITDSLSAGAIRDAGYDVPRATVRALKVGADMVLFNAAPARVASVAGRIVHAIVTAVRAGGLARSRLQDAAVHALRAKHLDLCG